MDMAVSQSGSVTIVTLKGRLDIETAQEVDDGLKELVAAGRKSLVLDVSDLSYVSSAGLVVFLHIYTTLKENHGALSIAGANRLVTKVLETTGFTRIIPCFAVLQEALAAAQP